MATITGNTDVSAEKRFYFDGKIELPCPGCKKTLVRDFSDQYLSYPETEKSIDESVYCGDCDAEYLFPIVLKSVTVTVEYDETKLRKI